MRYFLELAYNGTRFFGYQRQPNGISVQATLESALTTLLRHEVEIVGCGRTDTGVHARQYFVHFDTDTVLQPKFVHSLNALIGKDIVVYKLYMVENEAHARFDATSRSYEYYIDLQKNPFRQESAYWFPNGQSLDFGKMQEAASLLLNYNEFNTFCKSETDAKTRICHLTEARWVRNEATQQLIFYITANRFLRGMVRLIVGMCLQVGQGKIMLDEVRAALDKQTLLGKALSAPPQGLFLTNIHYNYLQAESNQQAL